MSSVGLRGRGWRWRIIMGGEEGGWVSEVGVNKRAGMLGLHSKRCLYRMRGGIQHREE